MLVLVTGVGGQLGREVQNTFIRRGIPCVGTTRAEMDITKPEQVEEVFRHVLPDAVVHCASYTNVAAAETDKETCNLCNITGTKNIAEACKEIGAKLLYVSTEYVFSGEKEGAYEIDDEKCACNVYGASKAAGEDIVKEILTQYFIVRISWLYGGEGNNFVNTLLRIGKEKDCISVVSDQIGSPTYTVDLAELFYQMITTECYGIYHAANEGSCSRAEFAREIFRLAGYYTKVKEITSDEYPEQVKRPKNSVLSKSALEKAGFAKLPEWKEGLQRYFKSIKSTS